MTSKSKDFSVICLLTFTIVIGCLIFCRGFLLNRQAFSNKAKPCSSVTDDNDASFQKNTFPTSNYSWCNPEPQFSQVIFVLLDAFRYDFIHRMPFLSSLLQLGEMQTSQNIYNGLERGLSTFSCAFKFIADPPTTTMQRLKALMTGTMPTFIDAGANFNSYEVEEDNLIYQLYAAGKRIAFLGDDTWLSLFSKSLFTSPYVEAHPSFNAWDLDTVDRAVNTTLLQLFEPDRIGNWDILITHFLGVDHCGHRYGPIHPEMDRKLGEADKSLEFIYNHMLPDSLLVVFGDHGMTKTGDHGGDSRNEVEAALAFVSTGYQSSLSPPFKCQSKYHNPQVVSQIDFAPTLSAMIGLPLPLSSIGQIFPNFLPVSLYNEAIMNNVIQVSSYLQDFAKISSPDLESLLDNVKSAYQGFSSQQNLSMRRRYYRSAETYFSNVKRIALSTWTKFDLVSIYWGIGITFFAITAIIQFIHFHVHLRKKLSWISCTTAAFGLISVFFNFFMGSSFGLLGIKAMTTLGLIIFNVASSLKESCSTPSTSLIQSSKICDSIAIILYALTCFGVFSNSFVINEGYVVGSVLLILSFLHACLQHYQSNDLDFTTGLSKIIKIRGLLPNKKLILFKNGVWTSWISLFVLGCLLRTGSFFFRCREELPECREDFLLHKHQTSLPDDWVVYKCIRFGVALLSVAIFVVTFREWMMARKCFDSNRPSAVIGRYMPTLLIVLTGAHWALEGLPFPVPHLALIRPALNYFPLVYQMLTLLALLVIWIQPLCSTDNISFKIDKTDDTGSHIGQDQQKSSAPRKVSKGQNGFIVGDAGPELSSSDNRENLISLFSFTSARTDGDILSSPLLIHCVLVMLFVIQITSTGMTPSLIAIPYVITAMLNLVNGSSNKVAWSFSVLWTLASQYYFYATGHQAVFSAIPWDSAFIGSTENLGTSEANSWINWLRPGLAVLANLYASQIIFSISLPLVIYWRSYIDDTTSKSAQTRHKILISETVAFAGKFLILHAIKLLACMISGVTHRRHLMVWKIFAPKLVFEIVSFLVTLVSTLVSLVLIIRIDYHYQKAVVKRRNSLKNLFRSNP